MKLGCPECLNVYDSTCLNKDNGYYICPNIFCSNDILDTIDENLIDIVQALWALGYTDISAFSGSVYSDEYLPYLNFQNLSKNEALPLYEIVRNLSSDYKCLSLGDLIYEVKKDDNILETSEENNKYSFIITGNDFNEEPTIKLRLLLMTEFIEFTYKLVEYIKINVWDEKNIQEDE